MRRGLPARREAPARGVQRLLPDSWQGGGREARWRRSRARRLLAAALCGLAVLAVVGAVRPADPPTRLVAVAARDLPAGSRLTAADVREVSWSAADHVPGAISLRAAFGAVLVAPISAGEPFTASRLRSARNWPSVPAGRVIIGVTAQDTAIARALRPGDRVDLIDTGRATTIASAVTVVSVTGGLVARSAGPAAALPSPTEPPAVLVAVTPAQAAAVGSAGAARSGGLGGGIQLGLRAGA